MIRSGGRKTLYFLCGYILPQSIRRNYARLNDQSGRQKSQSRAKEIYIIFAFLKTSFDALHTNPSLGQDDRQQDDGGVYGRNA